MATLGLYLGSKGAAACRVAQGCGLRRGVWGARSFSTEPARERVVISRGALVGTAAVGAIFAYWLSHQKHGDSMRLVVKQDVKPVGDELTLRVGTLNGRMAPIKEDDENENGWVHRCPKVVLVVQQYAPHILGLQEVSKMQMESLRKGLPQYEAIGRCPTRKPVESGLGILFNPKRIEQVSELKTVWLNEEKVVSDAKAWDGSNYERFIIYAQFKDVKTGKKFWLLTTHFDHMGVKARSESAKIVMDLAKELDGPVIATGDYNCFPKEGGPELYKLLCTHNPKMKDSRALAEHKFGIEGSWMGWSYDFFRKKEGDPPVFYDHIFVPEGTQVSQHGAIDDQVFDPKFGEELYPSDHRLVLADMKV